MHTPYFIGTTFVSVEADRKCMRLIFEAKLLKDCSIPNMIRILLLPILVFLAMYAQLGLSDDEDALTYSDNLGRLAKGYAAIAQNMSSTAQKNQENLKKAASAHLAVSKNLQQLTLHFSAAAKNRSCEKIVDLLSKTRISMVLASYEIRALSESSRIVSVAESLASETNKVIRRENKNSGCSSTSPVFAGNIPKQQENSNSLDKEFSESLENFKDEMVQARTDAVSEPLPPIAGQTARTRDPANSPSGKGRTANNGSRSSNRDKTNENSKKNQSESQCDTETEKNGKCNKTNRKEDEPIQENPESLPTNSSEETGTKTEIEEEMKEDPEYDASSDDIVARQIREAAMSEKDPELRQKLWDEYKKYKENL